MINNYLSIKSKTVNFFNNIKKNFCKSLLKKYFDRLKTNINIKINYSNNNLIIIIVKLFKNYSLIKSC